MKVSFQNCFFSLRGITHILHVFRKWHKKWHSWMIRARHLKYFWISEFQYSFPLTAPRICKPETGNCRLKKAWDLQMSAVKYPNEQRWCSQKNLFIPDEQMNSGHKFRLQLLLNYFVGERNASFVVTTSRRVRSATNGKNKFPRPIDRKYSS